MFQKNNLKKMRFYNILKLAFGTGSIFYVTIFSLIITAIMTLLIPISFKFLIDKGMTEEGGNSFIVLIGLAIALASGTALRYYSVNIASERIFRDIRQRFFDHVMTFSGYETDRFLVGDLVSRLVADAEMIRNFTASSLSVAARNILLLLGGFVMMLLTSPLLALIALGIIPIVIIPVLSLGKRLKYLAKNAQEKQATSNIRAEEMFFSLETIKNFNREAIEGKKIAMIAQDSYLAAKKRITIRAFLTFAMIALVFSGVVAVLWYGSLSVMNGTMSAGTLAQFLLYAVFTAGATGSLSEVWGEAQKAGSAFERIEEILRLQPSISLPAEDKLVTLPLLSGNIIFKDVSFAYPSQTKNTLHQINVTITAGQKIAFVGKSGSGKTSLLRLLLRQRDTSQGHIIVDGHDIKLFDPAFVRKNMAYVSQDVVLFTGTIFDNIAFGGDNPSSETVIEAAKTAYLHDFILSLPKGYETYIGERGINLSGGQKQRLTIARALIKNAPILLLDEATGALDSDSEHYVTIALEKLTENRTVISVAHRFSTLMRADMIYVLEDGKILEQGTHDSLLTQNGAYALLAKNQFLRVQDI